ncbi:MAG: hypothetical protein HYS23_05345 [Geobacter sp.]|nr:hypothetical protein [Geobacter sp.]
MGTESPGEEEGAMTEICRCPWVDDTEIHLANKKKKSMTASEWKYPMCWHRCL